MKYILSLIISGALVVSGFGQTRNVLVGTNNAVVQPTNFWSADASNARTGLGLGTAATNPATAFQPSNLTLSNLADNNGGGLTNLNATNIVGILSVAQGGTGSTNASDARTTLGLGTAATNPATAFQASSLNLSNLASGNGGSLTNLQASNLVGAIPASNIPSVTFTNLSGTLSVAQGGTGATNAANARQNLGSTTVGDALFVATNAEAARTAISLGTAATSAVTAFQPANANLTNLSTNNGASLTGIPIAGVVNLQSNLDTKLATNGNASGLSNITAANITGTVALASNITGTASLATNVTGIVALANGGTGATNAAGARTALGATTVGGNIFTLVNPSAIRFLRLNADNTATALSASDFRTAIGLSTAATNAESAFQPASTNLTTLAGNNGSALTNLQATNLVGLIPASNIPSTTLTNISGTLAIASGGTGATNASSARQNLGSTTVGDAVFIATNAVAARTAIGALTTNSDGSGLTNLTAANITGTVALASNIIGIIAISNGGSGATTAGGARTNLGLGATWLTNTTASDFLSAVGLGSTNSAQFGGLAVGGNLAVVTNQIDFGSPVFFADRSGTNAVFLFEEASDAAIARTNLGLGWPALTNTNSGTGLVSVNTNGEVVSPTNFWQAAPINTVLQNITNVVGNSTNAATNARLLFLYSLAPTVTNVTSTITLPTNGSTFGGDVATITHLGSTSSVTAIRALGASTNLIALNQSEESVRFIYRDGQWKLMDNISYIEPIFFSGTNAAANAAESRTNLGIPLPAFTNTNNANFRTAIELGATNNVTFNNVAASGTLTVTGSVTALSNAAVGGTLTSTGVVTAMTNLNVGGAIAVTNAALTRTNLGLGAADNVSIGSDGGSLTTDDFNAATINVSGSIAFTNAATTRTNLGIPLAALTNTDVTNFRTAIGLGATNDVAFSSVTIGPAPNLVISNGSLFWSTNNRLEIETMTAFAALDFDGGSFGSVAGETRTNLGLGASNSVTFAGLTSNGDITINQTATNNGLLYIYRTNAEPFLGLANLIASNNVTVSNESLFRVGVAEATNKAAQFGFRSTNTNGNGVAVFSVFGYNALMMIGPSDPTAGTNPIQATIYSIAPTNKVMTLITTNTGATLFHRAIEFENTTNQAITRTNLGLPLAALTNTNNAGFQRAIFQTNTTPTNGANLGDVKAWIEISVVTNSVTNSYRIPVFQ